MQSISHTWVLLYSQYVLLNICFARGIHVRALPIPIPFRVVQRWPPPPLSLLPLPRHLLLPTLVDTCSIRSAPLRCPARVSRRLLVSASTDRLVREWDSMYIADVPVAEA
ncbi:hypothetical protein B0H11DRAFT_2023081 [Mycena galericulata]|nr:hypothetical protein B0H11DRAFT_2023081 [Mycena galericulata]